jgi:purine-nucleoside phosphorylase
VTGERESGIGNRKSGIVTTAALADAVGVLRRRLGHLEPRVGIVLGSGLGGLAQEVSNAVRIPYADVPGFPRATVAGHAGEFVGGMLEGVSVLLQNGRFHLYEGHSPAAVALGVRALAALGIEIAIVTNAAGGLRPTFRPPILMSITDHINLMGRNPLIGGVEEGEERFPDMSEPYDRELRDLARGAATERGIRLEEGVYAAVTGPSYETPAEIRMLQRLGADAIGMSTVPEVITARARGVRVLGISTVTNMGAGISPAPLTHEEVLAAGRAVAADLAPLVRGVLRAL